MKPYFITIDQSGTGTFFLLSSTAEDQARDVKEALSDEPEGSREGPPVELTLRSELEGSGGHSDKAEKAEALNRSKLMELQLVTINLYLMSSRVLEVLDEAKASGFAARPCTLKHVASGRTYPGYWLVHFVVDTELDEVKDQPLFFFRDRLHAMFSEGLVKKLEALKLPGVAFEKAKLGSE